MKSKQTFVCKISEAAFNLHRGYILYTPYNKPHQFYSEPQSFNESYEDQIIHT